MDSRKGGFIIPRRPVTSAADPPPPAYSDLFPEPPPPPLPPRLRISKSVAQLHELPVQPHPDMPSPSPLSREKPATTLPPGFVFPNDTSSALGDPPIRRAKSSVDLRRPPDPPSWKKALDEARHLASGLLTSPAESTRHHSIIRHSSPLVWYRGPSTAVLLTVLSSRPLPAARTLHLQRRGLSGNLGMNLKARAGGGSGGADWLDVTPERRATPADLPELEERGVQRDLRRFLTTAGTRGAHVPRETLAVRIPAAAQDGYFRVVLCGEGGKVLVGSPVFRLASTAAEGVGVLRGAGLRTAPLEASWKDSMSAEARYGRAVSSATMRPTVGVLPGEDAPEAPFPLRVAGRVVRGTGRTRARYGFPTANLSGVPEELTARVTGFFAAWACLDDGPAWCEAVARVGPAEDAAPSVAARGTVAVHVLRDMEGEELRGRTLRLLLMGFLRPLTDGDGDGDGDEDGTGEDAALQGHADDVLTTLASLAREGWRPEGMGSEGWSLDGVAGRLAARVDALPVHRAGIRSEAGAMRDVSFGRGGLWIPR
ncbi:LipA and NB-ARC domain protein [Cordyceps fumosorosea ARSEF 2679]|uniref:Riboflavin kinase n=1 Tax=Cordyceps fumosorosea (strain ARSEF 2679) TaxID=1081104 RepID=A0A167LL91_CORFA|nr:LipA and NB-ARC domain protein [Cordyceps fumosorosea ARSEF 2679]OAA53217.1 LipA and NB-ARC domain protein [Cordyceps fumosorosea ARSEF 2679]